MRQREKSDTLALTVAIFCTEGKKKKKDNQNIVPNVNRGRTQFQKNRIIPFKLTMC